MKFERASAVLVFGLTPVLMFAQAFTGTIRGTVTDQTGGVLPGVTITIIQLQTNQVRTVVKEGYGAIFSLPKRPATVTIMAG